MSIQSTKAGISEQDRTLSDLLETYRHLQSDPAVDEDRKQRAAERMKSVWADLAKLQDPDGFINHLSEYVQQEHHRRHNAGEDPNVNRRGKPLCRCDRSRHVCEVKGGEIPSKIRTQDLTYLNKPDSRTLAREYIQEHSGDVVIREAMEDYRNLRAGIYSELSDILSMMMGRDEPQDTEDTNTDADVAASETSDPIPSETDGGADTPTASADGGENTTELEPAAEPVPKLETLPEDGDGHE